jgi:hypothetical protein
VANVLLPRNKRVEKTEPQLLKRMDLRREEKGERKGEGFSLSVSLVVESMVEQ